MEKLDKTTQLSSKY